MPCHRAVVAADHRGRGREVLSLAWTYAHHDRGLHIWGVQVAWDQVEKRSARYQTVVTAVLAKRELIDGVAVVVPPPNHQAEEMASWQETVRASYEQMAEARRRVLELLPHLLHRQSYRKRTEIAHEIVQQREDEGHVPQANYAFNNSVLTVELTGFSESVGKHWVSALACSRPIQWQGRGQRVEAVAAGRRRDHPERFRPVRVRCRNGDPKPWWVCTKVIRLQRYGRKRLGIVHAQEDLGDAPQFLLTDALHWESGRIIETWSDRWTSAIFHECSKQVTGLQAPQGRKEDAVPRHLHWSGGWHKAAPVKQSWRR
jgi:hypothetical protein